MAEEEENFEAEDGEAEEGKGKSAKGNKKLLFIVLPLLLLVGAIAGIYIIGSMGSLFGGSEEVSEEASEEGGEGAEGQQQGVIFYDLPNILVNINTRGRKSTFLKVSIALELASEADRAKVTSLEPRIVDNFQVYLRELRLDELQGSAGMYRLKEELMSRVNHAINPAKVNDVLFKEMLIQ